MARPRVGSRGLSLTASVRFICPKSAVGCILGRDRQATHGRQPGLAPNTFTYQALMAGTSCG